MKSALAAPEDLPQRDESLRARWRLSGVPRDLATAELSFHPDGRVRERVVKLLAKESDGGELPYLLVRLNDWAEPVREAARTAVMARIRPDYIRHFVTNAALLARVAGTRRADHAELLDGVVALVAARTVEVVAALPHATTRARRAVFRMLAVPRNPTGFLGGERPPHCEDPRGTRGTPMNPIRKRTPDDPAMLATAAAVDADPMIRLFAVRLAPAEELLTKLVADRVPAVRRAALEALAHDRVRPYAQQALLDRNASVRETARVLLRDAAVDFAAFYRAALASRPAIAIAGLAESGEPADVERIAPYLAHESPTVRRAAVRAVAQLGGEAFLEQLVPQLADRSPAVSAAAGAVLRRYARRLDGTRLWTIFAGATAAHVRRDVLSVLAGLPKWQSIIYLLRAAVLSELAERHVVRWNAQFNRSQTVPSRDEVAQLREALTLARGSVPDAVLREIAFSIA